MGDATETSASRPETVLAGDGFDYRAARDWVFALGLTPTLKLVMLSLVEHMPNCRPSVARLAGMSGVERKTVLRAIGRLEQLGHLAVERGNGARSAYSLVMHRSQPVPTSPTYGDRYQSGTGPKSGPNRSQQPVPTSPKSGPNRSQSLVPEAGSRSRKQEAGLSAREPVARTYSLPSKDPPDAYLQEADMYPVSRQQASSTWRYWHGKGLPEGGVERPHMWLLQQAKEREGRQGGPAQAIRGPALMRQPNHGKTGFEILGDKAPKI